MERIGPPSSIGDCAGMGFKGGEVGPVSQAASPEGVQADISQGTPTASRTIGERLSLVFTGIRGRLIGSLAIRVNTGGYSGYEGQRE